MTFKMDEKTLCNLNGMVARCDGVGWTFNEPLKYCDSAKRSSHGDNCMHLCKGERCDSHIAQDIAVKLK
jgi:hypothetical protein